MRPTPLPIQLTHLSIIVVAVAFVACGGSPGANVTAPAARAPSAVEVEEPAVATAPAAIRLISGGSNPDLRNDVWSPSGRYLLVEEGVVDVDARTLLPIVCRTQARWGSDTLVACVGADGHVDLFDMVTLEHAHFVDCVSSFEWRDSGRTVACTSEPFTFDVAGGVSQPLPAGSSNEVGDHPRMTAGGPSPDGRLRLEIGIDGNAFLTNLRSMARSSLGSGALPNLSGTTYTSYFSPDSQSVLVPLSKGGARIIKTAAGVAVRTLRSVECDSITAVAWSSDGKQIALGDNDNVCLFEVATGKPLRSWKAPPAKSGQRDAPGTTPGYVTLLAFTPSGDGLLVGTQPPIGSNFADVSVYRAATGERLGEVGTTDFVRFLPSGATVVLQGRIETDLTIHSLTQVPWQYGTEPRISPDRAWWVLDGALHSLGPVPTFEGAEGADFVVFDSSSTKVAGTVNGRARVWSLQTGKVLWP